MRPNNKFVEETIIWRDLEDDGNYYFCPELAKIFRITQILVM